VALRQSEFQEAARAHADKLNNLIDRGSVPRLRKVYQQAVSELEGKLATALKSGSAPFSIQQHRSLLAQARTGLVQLSRSMTSKLGEETAGQQEAAARALIIDVKRLEKKATGAVVQLPIEQAARFAGVVDKRKTSLLKHHQKLMSKTASASILKIEGALAQSLVQGETGYAAVSRVVDAVGGEWWRSERIVRTESAWAYNATHVDAAKDAVKTFPDLMMRWSEQVSDVTLLPLDNRTGDDSRAMHGQLARPGGLFMMQTVPPPGLKVSLGLLGQSWDHPPNRPHDRATLTPWRPGWGWAWELVNGQRVYR
jgi:hypothetical protein